MSIANHELAEALALARSRASEVLLLSTCNRTEAFVTTGGEGGVESLIEFFAEWGDLSPADVAGVIRVREGREAVRHALRIAGGLDSMVLGEDQIQSQFRHALTAAQQAGTLGATMHRLGSAALACGKRVRTFTGVGRHSVSLESLAVRAAADAVGDLAAHQIVVLGAGDSGAIVARQLRAAGAGRLTIVSRSAERATALAADVSATAGGLAELSEAVARADVLFACTSAPHPVLTTDFLAHRAALRGDAPLLCVDLGMPRDVHPDVTALAGIRVITLDDLAAVAETHREDRRAHLPAAEAIVDAEVARFADWLQVRAAANAIAAVDATVTRLAEEELERALARLPLADEATRNVLAELAHRLARKLSHEPKQAIRLSAGREAAHG